MDDETLRALTYDLKYEVEMLAAAAYIAERIRYPTFWNNVLIESWLVHVRVLGDFLDCRKLKDNDVTARDYFPGWKVPDVLKDERDAINRRLAHLTTDRMDRQYAYSHEMTARVLGSFVSFVAKVEREYLTDYLITAKVLANEYLNSDVEPSLVGASASTASSTGTTILGPFS